MKMKQALYFGNTHILSVKQQIKSNSKKFIQKRFRSVKKWLHHVLNFVKKSLEENGDFFLNGNDF